MKSSDLVCDFYETVKNYFLTLSQSNFRENCIFLAKILPIKLGGSRQSSVLEAKESNYQ